MAIKTGRRYQMATAFLKGRICFIFTLLLTATGVIAAPSKKLESLFKLSFPRQTKKQGVLKKSAPRQDYSEKLDSIVYQYYDEEFIFDAYEKRKETFLYDSYGNRSEEHTSELQS